MTHILPTVRVVSPESPDGFIVINESDLTPEHKLWEEPRPAAEAEAAAKAKAEADAKAKAEADADGRGKKR
jgi:hypothetical protein